MSESPQFPRLTFRIGFAGSQEPTADGERHLRERLPQVFDAIAWRLAELAPGTPIPTESPSRVAKYFSHDDPLFRLVSGLCDGADAIAMELFPAVKVCPPDAAPGAHSCVSTELAAVIPFEPDVYRNSQKEAFRPRYDALVRRCAYLQVLDGIFDKPDPDTELAYRRRKRAYRAQTTFLLRQVDLLVAAADPGSPGKPGGTLEAVQSALEFELPVVFLHTGNGTLHVLGSLQDFRRLTETRSPGETDWKASLDDLIRKIMVDPDLQPHREETGHHGKGKRQDFLAHYFSPASAGLKPTFGQWAWKTFEDWFAEPTKDVATKKQEPKSPSTRPYARYRDRASDLSTYFSGRYRGTFLVNYALAVFAVALATLSLIRMGYTAAGTSHSSDSPTAKTEAPHDASHPPASDHAPTEAHAHGAHGPDAWLLFLGAGKLIIVGIILWSTRRANAAGWNALAVDARYLSERLRAMLYLPKAGSVQPPVVVPPQYASRIIRQSEVEWLFDAITRSVSPAEIEGPPAPGTVGPVILRVDAQSAVRTLRDKWIRGQADYHERNRLKMRKMQHFFHRWGSGFSISVIVAVILDLLILLLPTVVPSLDFLHAYSPWLILMAAVLPAAVASVNGIRVQAECDRLAERSEAMRAILVGPKRYDPSAPNALDGRMGRSGETDLLSQDIQSATSAPSTDPASWSVDALLLTETVAQDFAREVSEWSVLYAKDVLEP